MPEPSTPTPAPKRKRLLGAFGSRLSYANVMATIAAFLALGGTSVAATGVLITNSSQIKDGAVTGQDVKNSSLTGADVRDHSLTPSDFSGSVAGAQGPMGSTGATGAPGPQGPRGATGAQGPSGPQGVHGNQGPAGPAGATGEKGDPGATGEKGDPGPRGPAGADGADGAPQVSITRDSEARTSDLGGPDNPTQTAFSETVTLPSPGTYMVSTDATLQGSDCPPGDVGYCNILYGLALDGKSIPHSGSGNVFGNSNATIRLNTPTVFVAIPAGTHTISLPVEQLAGPAMPQLHPQYKLNITGPYAAH